MKKTIITEVQAFVVNPSRHNYVVVKVSTDRGIDGYGCATFQFRPLVVKEAIETYLKPLLIGKDANNIEDLWHVMTLSSYWRNGPVLNNAVAGIDMALWDIKAKIAKMPLYQLLGGKVRNFVSLYSYAEGNTIEEVLNNIDDLIGNGYKYIRCQIGLYGGIDQETVSEDTERLEGVYYSPKKYIEKTVELFKTIREKYGYEIELIHDVHERLDPNDALLLCKLLEPYNLYFIEDPVSPTNVEWIDRIRNNTIIPIAIGELFNNPAEYISLIQNKKIDFLRIHVSQIGGITPALKIIGLCELNDVKIVWHTPSDISPIGLAVNLHLNYTTRVAPILEFKEIDETMSKIFPGSYRDVKGKIVLKETEGIGVSFDEEIAKDYPNVIRQHEWTQSRLEDGTIHTP